MVKINTHQRLNSRNMKADRDIEKLQEPFKSKVKLLMELCPEIFITEAYRTAERQNWLYRNNPSSTSKDGYKNKSQHQKGLAIDIAFHGAELYPINHQKWRQVADKAKGLGIDWGYDLWYLKYNFIDKPHFQCNGEELNTQPMNDYVSMAEDIKDPVLKEMSGEAPLSEGQVKALINIAIERALAKIADKLTK